MQQFVDFLAQQPPYDALDPADLERLATNVDVAFYGAGEVILDTSRPSVEHIFVIRNGLVHLVDSGNVIDELGTGETFGQVAVLTGLPPAVEVRAVEETLCYLIPDPRRLLRHPERLYARYGTLKPQPAKRPDTLSADRSRPVGRLARPVPIIPADTPIRQAAATAADGSHSCLFVEYDDGFGIVTDTDYRGRVATGEVSVDQPLRSIAKTPMRTVPESMSTGQAFAEMVRHDIHHLAVLNARGRPAGVLRVLDVGAAELRGPLTLRAAVERASTKKELADAALQLHIIVPALRQRGVPAAHVAEVMSAVRDSVVQRAIALCAEMADRSTQPTARAADANDAPLDNGVDMSWLVLGSQARREPLPLSDIDTAMVIADGATLEVVNQMRAVAEDVLTTLELCGLPRCPDGANATNPLFSRTQTGWLMAARTWQSETNTGTLLLSAMVADSRPVTNAAVSAEVFEQVARRGQTRDFQQSLMNFALASRPPTGFVRDFVVESSGRHRGQLDLKRRGLRPVVSLGQWIAITTGSSAASTPQRLRHGAAEGLLTNDEADTLSGAYDDMYELLFDHELEALVRRQAADTYLSPATLDTLTRRHLRESFRAIAKVQSRLEGEWVSRLR